MKPYHTYCWTTVFLSPTVTNGKLKEASRVISYNFYVTLDSKVNLNMIELAMRQMPRRLLHISYVQLHLSLNTKNHSTMTKVTTLAGPALVSIK